MRHILKYLFIYIILPCLAASMMVGCSNINARNEQNVITKIEQLNRIGFENTINKKEVSEYFEKENDTLNALIKLLNKNKHAIIIDQKQLIAGSMVFYTDFFKQLSELEPSFQFQSFFTELKQGEDFDYYFDKAAWVGLTTQGAEYESYLYYDENNPVSPNFYQLANRVLADQKSNKRYYGVNIFCEDCASDYYVENQKVNNNQFAIVALTQAQADKIKENKLLSITDISHEILTSKEINLYIKQLTDQKIITLGNKEYQKQKMFELKMSEYYNKSQLLENFDSSLCVITREAFAAQPYLELLQCLQYISHGDFNPINITDNYKMDTISQLKFNVKSKKYEFDMTNTANHIDVSVLETINKTMMENEINGQFYFINNFENEGMLIYLTNSQYNYFIDNKLIELIPVESLFNSNNIN